jgi:hypothetical protein
LVTELINQLACTNMFGIEMQGVVIGAVVVALAFVAE